MKRQTDEFFIGWQDTMPAGYTRIIRRALGLIAGISLLAAAGWVLGQRGFEASVFEFGMLKEIEGTLVMHPVPMLKRTNPDGTGTQSLLLVGLGKYGALETLRQFEAREGRSLDGATLRLRGSLIYHQDKTAFELTEGVQSLLAVLAPPAAYTPHTEPLGQVTLLGEILDPKCALGVMKPGYGKPHRACAIRCLSGGIPAVLQITRPDGQSQYCLLAAEGRATLDTRLLDYVADPIQICGRLVREDDWLVLYLPPTPRLYRLGYQTTMPGCGAAGV
ncbi:MAG: hypothetical protein SF053_08520 [Bacteroidia bacterium]|nr:hypothetical protein [Bacteroidia bacterium]